ncbi:MAG: hypothetical protein A3D92_05010 [Bacteroidetes bacterium RIFCSPHIGHO2_02_FULL_44_7]|nr:MAG: hypothetical protein A3D92_05010 [Bacteroidetes bacterium RIFCSPHIGHO2_02_FULL_44_7]
MKSILLILSFVVTGQLFAQGNLQFNQVILQDFNSTVAGWATVTSSTFTVPAGKVWKIEHAEAWYYLGVRSTAGSGFSLYVNNTLLRRSRSSSGNINQGGDHFPVWLPAGSYDIIIANETSTSYNFTGSISAIEFNVIP